MKQLITLLLLFVTLNIQYVWAQELTVQRFVLDQEKVYGSTEARLDGTGEQYCALVLVQLPTLQGVTFDGEIVNPIEPRGGEYWVYMVAGSKYLRIKHPSVHPLEIKFADYGIAPLQSKATYVLKINVPQLGQVQQDDGFRYLAMSVKPVNASVFIDGNQMDVKSDGTLMKPFAQGRHTYIVSAVGYVKQEGTFTITDHTENLQIQLQNSLSQLTVSCATPDAEIYIDNVKRGSNSPWTGSLPPSTYTVEARREGYQTQRQIVSLSENQQLTVTLPALVPRVGILDVAFSPMGAEVWLGGNKLGTSPDIFRNIPIGSHQVELRKEGYQPVSQRVTIEEGKTASLSGSLVQTTAAVQSSSSIPGQSSAASPVAANGAAKTFTVNGVSFMMIAVQGGTFEMGATSEQQNPDRDETPVHSVTLSDYYIGETEVTQALWVAVMGSNPSRFKGDNLPVEMVSWDDCQEFLRKLNKLTGQHFRLPTEAEWEYAARGGNKSRKTQYAGSSNIDEVAWYAGNSGNTTHAVKTKQPNELELYDMSGNVHEWCQDWFGSYSRRSRTNPTGPSSGSGRAYRDGSWPSIASFCRSAIRGGYEPSHRDGYLGLRLAL